MNDNLFIWETNGNMTDKWIGDKSIIFIIKPKFDN